MGKKRRYEIQVKATATFHVEVEAADVAEATALAWKAFEEEEPSAEWDVVEVNTVDDDDDDDDE
jgi:hypothetical protein